MGDVSVETITIASLSAIIGVIATLLTMFREAKKGTRHDAEHSTTVREEIKYISRGIEDIKYDTRSLTASTANMNERLIRVEESVKNAHEKIDSIKKGDV